MTTFRIAQHSIEDERAVVEIFDGGVLVAVLYADDGGRRLRVVSKYLDAAETDWSFPPTVNIRLKGVP